MVALDWPRQTRSRVKAECGDARIDFELHQVPEAAHAVNVADDLHSVANVAIEDKVSADGKMAEAGGDVVARFADLWIVRKRPALFVKHIEKPVGCGGIITGDVAPDLDQILFGSRRPQQAGRTLAHGLSFRGATPGFLLDRVN